MHIYSGNSSMAMVTFWRSASPCALLHRWICPFSQSKCNIYRSRYSHVKTLSYVPYLSKRAGRQGVSARFSTLRNSAGPSELCRAFPEERHAIPDNELVILGIETSCDDTGAAVVTGDGKILSQIISSQLIDGQFRQFDYRFVRRSSSCIKWAAVVRFDKSDLLAKYGGVAPKMAQEAHAQAIDEVIGQALQNAHLRESDLSAIAVTIGPGLSLCLRVGVRKARNIAGKYNLPMVDIHHMEAHALVARLTRKDLQFPFLALLISGGHNLLILAQNVGQYIQLGTTIDDAIGEAYDKTARWLGLDMMKGGGPALEELAREGDPYSIKFSVPMRQHKDCNFSYAGLKTQVRLAIESRSIDVDNVPIALATTEDRKLRADIAASFQRVAVLHLEQKCDRAVEWAQSLEPSIECLVVSGGVASNQYVRMRLDEIVKKHNLQLVCPPPTLCTDNGVMVAWAGIEHFRLGRFEPPPPVDEPEDVKLDLRPRWQLGEIYAEGRSDARSLKRSRVFPSLTSSIQASMQCQ